MSGRHHAVETQGAIRDGTVEEQIIRRAGDEVGEVNPRNRKQREIRCRLDAVSLADGQRGGRDEARAGAREWHEEFRRRWRVGGEDSEAEFTGVAGGGVRGDGRDKVPGKITGRRVTKTSIAAAIGGQGCAAEVILSFTVTGSTGARIAIDINQKTAAGRAVE